MTLDDLIKATKEKGIDFHCELVVKNNLTTTYPV